MAKRKKQYCQTKRRYRDESGARSALAVIRRHSERDTIPKRVYWCGKCNGWHLTSSDKKEMVEF